MGVAVVVGRVDKRERLRASFTSAATGIDWDSKFELYICCVASMFAVSKDSIVVAVVIFSIAAWKKYTSRICQNATRETAEYHH